jgi:DNA polymerase-3 subunit epsilon
VKLWRALHRPGAQKGPVPNPSRWVVLDVETTGLDVRADALLSVAGLAVHIRPDGPSLFFADQFEVVLQQTKFSSSHDNVLIHRLGWGQQKSGVRADEALNQLRTWVGDSPVVAYHARFDKAFLDKAFAQELNAQLNWHWLDLAYLLPGAFEHVRANSIDAWMERLGVKCVQRHQAAADVWATAQLLLMAWPHWQKRGDVNLLSMQSMSRQNRWLNKLAGIVL